MRLLLPLAAILAAAPTFADATALTSHQAVYDLRLAGNGDDIVDADGRIAMVLTSKSCGVYDLDYRFVARFRQDQEVTLTDQQTNSTENQPAEAFRFSTKTFVDGSPEKEIRGEAKREGDGTKVSMVSPEKRSFELPLSRYPMQHTMELIQRAKAGERIVETKLFDGDDDAEKGLTSTSIIAPNEASAPSAEPTRAAKPGADPKTLLAGLKSWKISESYYNSDSDADGMPVFQTTYVLYENGVSDQLTLDFGSYVFAGSLSKLEILDTPVCK